MWDADGRKTGEFILKALGMKGTQESTSIISFLVWMGILAVVIATLIGGCECAPAHADQDTGSRVYSNSFITETSYFTYASCIREGTSGIMANGKVLNDAEFICASWDYKFGTKLRITRVDRPELSCIVTVCDRGPSKKLYKRGRRLDISLAAAKALKMVKSGLAKVSVEVI